MPSLKESLFIVVFVKFKALGQRMLWMPSVDPAQENSTSNELLLVTPRNDGGKASSSQLNESRELR